MEAGSERGRHNQREFRYANERLLALVTGRAAPDGH
jgi:hypothetical protein